MENREEKITVVDSVCTSGTVRSIGSTIMVIAAGGLIIIVGLGVWAVSPWLPVVGYVAIGAAILTLVSCAAFPFVALLRFLFRRDYVEIGPSGTVDNWLWKSNIYAPLAVANTKMIAGKGKMQTRIEPIIPSLIELLDSEEIRIGMTDMILGYLETGEVVRGPWPRTFAVGGKGRSGKTRRVIFMIIQALLGHAHITICDPHYTKKDSLTKELEALSPWLHFAGTDEQIIQAASDFLNEMEKRVRGESQEIITDTDYKPRLIIFDEWSRLMTRIAEEDTEKLAEVVTATSQEYAGFNGFSCIIGQSWTNDTCGGTAIRRALHAVFVHRIDTDYAKFLVKPRKFYSQSEQLATGHCFYQDLDGQIRKLIMPNVPDKACVKVAEIMMQVSPLERREELSPVEQVQQIATRSKNTAPLSPYQLIEAPTSKYPTHTENELETVILMPGSNSGSDSGSTKGSDSGSDERVTDETFVKVLREIGKRLKKGETPNGIRRSLGIDGGRALQEVNAALNFLQEYADTSMEVE